MEAEIQEKNQTNRTLHFLYLSLGELSSSKSPKKEKVIQEQIKTSHIVERETIKKRMGRFKPTWFESRRHLHDICICLLMFKLGLIIPLIPLSVCQSLVGVFSPMKDCLETHFYSFLPPVIPLKEKGGSEEGRGLKDRKRGVREEVGGVGKAALLSGALGLHFIPVYLRLMLFHLV